MLTAYPAAVNNIPEKSIWDAACIQSSRRFSVAKTDDSLGWAGIDPMISTVGGHLMLQLARWKGGRF